MGKCGFRANPDRRGVFSNTKMYFQTAGMYFQTLPIVISHTRLAPGAYYRRVYCPESRKREAKNEGVRIIKKRGKVPLNQLVWSKQHNSASRKTTYRGFKFGLRQGMFTLVA